MLDSVARHLPGARTLVVDCASADDSAGGGAGAGPGCDVDGPATRTWASAGPATAGWSWCRTPVTALINPDVELVDDSLLALVAEALARRPRRAPAGAAGAQRRRQPPGHRAPASGFGGRSHPVARAAGGRSRVAPARRWRRGGRRARGGSAGRSAVRWWRGPTRCGRSDRSTSRCSCTARTWSWGCTRGSAGVETWLWPAARVIHHRAHSTAERAFGGEAFERLAARAPPDAVRRRRGRRWAALDDAAQPLTFASRGRPEAGARPAGERASAGSWRRSRALRRRARAMTPAPQAAADSPRPGRRSSCRCRRRARLRRDGPPAPRRPAPPRPALPLPRPSRSESTSTCCSTTFATRRRRSPPSWRRCAATGATVARSDALWEATEPRRAGRRPPPL